MEVPMINGKHFLVLLIFLIETQTGFAMNKRILDMLESDDMVTIETNKKANKKTFKRTYKPEFNKYSTKELIQLFTQETEIFDSSYVETLLINDADPNIYIKPLLTPLHYAAQKGDYKTVETLLRFGATITAQDTKGSTVLHCVASHNNLNNTHLKIIEILYKYDAERYKQYKQNKNETMNYQDSEKFIPLHYIPNNEGNIPLHSAITVTTHKPLMELLVHNNYFSKKDLEDIFIDESDWEKFRNSVKKNESEGKSLALVTPPQTIDIKNKMGLSAYDILTQKLKILKSDKHKQEINLQYSQIEEIINLFDEYKNKK